MLSIVLLYIFICTITAIKMYCEEKKDKNKHTTTNESDNKGADNK